MADRIEWGDEPTDEEMALADEDDGLTPSATTLHRRKLATIAVLLRKGNIRAALAEIPVTEYERLAETLEHIPPRTRSDGGTPVVPPHTE